MTKVLLAIYDCLARRPWNDVWYKYVGGGNGAGQVSSRQDASGVTEYGYDETGNVTESRKTCVIPGNRGTLTMVTRWSYDSHGRVLTVSYPDGEEVSYTYDRGGSLCGMAGEKPGQPRTVYIDTLQYNTYGQRTYIRYGNGVTTTYSYNPIDHRLIHLRDSSSLTGELLQDNSYSYDREGNILGIADQGRLGRVQSYRYDDLYRLVHSQGEMGVLGLSYDSEYGYSAAGRLTKKRVSSLRLGSRGLYPVNYDNEYRYPYGSNPFAAERITDGHGNHDLKWDDDGNMTGCGDEERERRMCWTEEGRLQAYWDRQREEGVQAAYYSYDGAGERSLKLVSPRVETVQNAEAGTVSMRYATLYASPLVTINRGGYTKHYFEGSNRVCTAIGGGFGGVDWSEVEEQVPAINGDYRRMHEMQDESVNKVFDGCIGVGASVRGVYNLPAIIEKQERWRNETESLHYYHGDHVGSAAYLTDRDGHVVQTLTYLPYGEDWVEQNGLGDTSRLGMYRYNGKEKDYESGYHYYGARYYWSELWTGWLSVDPMSDKYPSISPYAYCAWNPVKLVDPDGEKIKNAYQEYNNVTERIASLEDQYAKCDTRNERRSIQREIKYLKRQHSYYKLAQGAIDAFKEANPEEFQLLDNLTFNDHDVDITVSVDMTSLYSPNNGNAETIFPSVILRKNSDGTLESVEDILSIEITLYRSAFFGETNGLTSIANEMGDAKFMIMRPEQAVKGYFGIKNNNISYWKESASRFSYDYEKYITNPAKNENPNPFDY